MKKTNAGPGDFVEVSLMKNSYRGTLLETPAGESGVIMLKLESGYNLGFNKKDVYEINLLMKAEETRPSVAKLKHDPEKPNIAMIITGGTIASRLDIKTGAAAPLTSSEDLLRFYPEIFQKVNVTKIEMPFMKSSEDMDFRDWQKIARTAVKLLNDPNIKGIIITHGTDTLGYTAAALSFFLRDVNKPVVLTYSQRSTDRASSDANLNLKCAAVAAISDIAEVMLVGHATQSDDFCYAMPGAKVRKMHTSRRDTFRVVNGKPFAKIWPDKIEIISSHRVREKKKAKADTSFEEKVALVKFHPGQDADILDYYKKRGYRGIVIEMTGLGHVAVSGKKSWIRKLKEVQKKGMIVCAAAQTIFGRLDPWVYSSGRDILNTGVIYLEDMLAETALVKLGWVLGRTKKKEEVEKLMLTNISGELNHRLEE